MNNKQSYQETFQQINISEESLSDIMNIDVRSKSRMKMKNMLVKASIGVACMLFCIMCIDRIVVIAYGESLISMFTSTDKVDDLNRLDINVEQWMSNSIGIKGNVTSDSTYPELYQLLEEHEMLDVFLPHYKEDSMELISSRHDYSSSAVNNIVTNYDYVQIKLSDGTDVIDVTIDGGFSDTTSYGVGIGEIKAIEKNNMEFSVSYVKESYSYEEFLGDLDTFFGSYYDNDLELFHSTSLYEEISRREGYENFRQYSAFIVFVSDGYSYSISISKGIDVDELLESIY